MMIIIKEVKNEVLGFLIAKATDELCLPFQVTVNGKLVPVPYTGGNVEASVYGAIMHEVRLNDLGHIFTFTPQNNEFQLQLSPKTFAAKTYGLCGKSTPFFPRHLCF